MDWRALMASRTFMVFPDEAKDAAVEGKGSKETSERCRSLLARSTSAGSRAKSRDRRRKHVLVKGSPASKSRNRLQASSYKIDAITAWWSVPDSVRGAEQRPRRPTGPVSYTHLTLPTKRI